MKSFVRLLSTFALLVELETVDTEKADRELLERRDPFILLTKDGPDLLTRLKLLGLISPFHGRDRLVVQLLVAHERFKLQLLRLDRAGDFIKLGHGLCRSASATGAAGERILWPRELSYARWK